MAFDLTRAVTVLFGSSETWEWSGIAWSRRAVTGPAARTGQAVAYDPGRRVTLLFGGLVSGGNFATYSGETWEWNGTGWSQRPVSGPSPRDSHSMAYDSARAVGLQTGQSPRALCHTPWPNQRVRKARL